MLVTLVTNAQKKRARTIVNRLHHWYLVNGRDFPWRRPGTTSYQLVVSEMLLQRTRASTVAAMYPAFFGRFPSWEKVVQASEEDLQVAFKPIGLWRRRAKSFRMLAEAMVTRGGVFSRCRDEIELLPGVGQYIGNAVELFVHGRPRPLLDVNMVRVIERYFHSRHLADIRHDPWLQAISKHLVETSSNFPAINWALLDLGATICKPKNPDCSNCPLSRGCAKDI